MSINGIGALLPRPRYPDAVAGIASVLRAGEGAVTRLRLGSWWLEALMTDAQFTFSAVANDEMRLFGVPVERADDPFEIDVE